MGRGEKSLLGDPGSEQRLGREKEEEGENNVDGMSKKYINTKNQCLSFA